MGQIARERAWRERNQEEGGVTLHVTLDWLVRVEGTTDEDEAREIVAGYLRDQSDLAESMELDPPDEDDWELTLVLYPDDVTVPEDTGLAAGWSTYHRTPAEFRERGPMRFDDEGTLLEELGPRPAVQGSGLRGLPAWCGDTALHEPHYTDSATECPGVSAVRPAR